MDLGSLGATARELVAAYDNWLEARASGDPTSMTEALGRRLLAIVARAKAVSDWMNGRA